MGPLAIKFEEPGDGGAQTRHPNVVGVGQGEGRAVLDHENVGGVVVHLRLVGGVLLSPVSGYTRIRRDLPACQGGCLWPRDRGLTGIVVMVGISSPPRV